jgi:DNA-binding XRE family transcriptional regulator
MVTRFQNTPECGSGDWVKALRTKIGVSPSGLGQILDVSAETVRRWEKGEVKPQSAQQTKLTTIHSVVSAMNNPTEELLTCGLVQKLASARKLDLRHSNVAGELDLSDDPRVPAWWFDLQVEFHCQNWESVVRWMRYFKDELPKLPSPAHEAALNWKATALLRRGYCEDAERELRTGLARCQSDVVRVWLENNLAVALMGRRKYDEAAALFDKLQKTAVVDTPLYNRLCIASLQRNLQDCRRLCGELLAFHGGKIPAASPRAKALKSDPDLAWLRESDLFSEHFSYLTKKARSSMATVAQIMIFLGLVASLFAAPACARETIGAKRENTVVQVVNFER